MNKTTKSAQSACNGLLSCPYKKLNDKVNLELPHLLVTINQLEQQGLCSGNLREIYNNLLGLTQR